LRHPGVGALPNLKERTHLDKLYSAGGHSSPQADEAMNGHQATQVPTAIRGRTPRPDNLRLSDYEIKKSREFP
jgi:hypothetical protein